MFSGFEQNKSSLGKKSLLQIGVKPHLILRAQFQVCRTFRFSERMKTTEQEMFILGEVDHVTKCSHAISDSGAAKAIELKNLHVNYVC